MIIVRATIKGEPDVPAITKFFEYGSADEEIFFSSAAMVEEKLRCEMKLNANEALVLFCSYVVKSIRAGKKESSIQNDGAKILSAGNTMIGVPETLRSITFEARIDNLPARKIILKEPVSASKSLLAS
ncbi:MAG: urease subunit gamma [Nitrososphaera sp.]